MFYAISGLMNAITSAAVGLYVFTRDPKDRRYQTYALFCLSLTVWSFGYFFWQISNNAEDAVLWVRIFMAGAIFIPVTNFHHILELLGRAQKEKSFIRLGYGVCTVFLLLDLFSFFIVQGVVPKSGFLFWPNPGPAFHVYLVFLCYCVGSFAWLLIQEGKKAAGIRKNQLRYLLLALILGYAGGFTNFPLWYGVPIPPVGNILVSVYVLLFSYAVVKFRLLDIEIVIKRGLTYAYLLLALIIPCYLLVIWGQTAAFGKISFSFSLMTLILFLAVGFLFPKLRFRTEEAFERVLFRKRYDYRETLLQSSRDMISLVDLENLSNKLVHTVGEALRIQKVSLFFPDEFKGSFAVKASVGLNREQFDGTVLLRDDPLVQRLMKQREILVREELELAQNGDEGKNIAERMEQLQAEITLPLMSKERTIGILNLGYKEGKEMYSHEDIELLSTLANQAAIAVENAGLYENLKSTQRIIQRADRLSSLGMLTAGLAHEIRNPLVAIRTFTQLLPERYQDPEFRNTFQSLALKEVDRICSLVSDLLSFARPSPPNVTAENINGLVETIARLLETEAKEKGIQICQKLAPDLPKIYVDREQIKQVSMNVILNAIQSIEGEGVVEVSTRLYGTNGSETYVQIRVHDSGVGISESDLEHIFNPFFTTKKDGSGLGLSISHQIVKEHGGYITVESKIGEGTTFLINLPDRRGI
jgi:two-component system nitrogen regulation sensor histidine kinase GlnL